MNEWKKFIRKHFFFLAEERKGDMEFHGGLDEWTMGRPVC